MFDQIFIQILLIAAFVIFGIILLRSGGSARTQAIRTITLVLLVAAAVFAVLFPGAVDALAKSIGVGRGADLLLYGFIVVFIGNALTTTRRMRAQNAQMTLLARKIALMNPLLPSDRADERAASPREES